MNVKKIGLYSILALVISLGAALLIWWFLRPRILFKEFSFHQLPGWDKAELKQSLKTFQVSCHILMKENPEQKVGSKAMALQVKDWLPLCQEALITNPHDAKTFFMKWFIPLEFYEKGKPIPGLFTGYFMPTIKGSPVETSEFSVPIYKIPKNLVVVHVGHSSKHKKVIGRIEHSKILPFYTREEIDKGAIKNTAKVLAWIHSRVDRMFLEIEGSGVIQFKDGKKLFVGYNGQNGLPYTSIAAVLIKRGVMTKENASMQFIKHYLETHPEKEHEVLNQNKSFVFFKELPENTAYGTQNTPLTAGYSLAVDRHWIPFGMPLWLSTTKPDEKNINSNVPMDRLMVAQDTGGAITGKVRGDVFWGDGDMAVLVGGHMKNKGYYWLLVPNHVLPRLEEYLIQ